MTHFGSFEHRDLSTASRKLDSCGQTSNSAADDSDLGVSRPFKWIALKCLARK
jgi:hypothetical protein